MESLALALTKFMQRHCGSGEVADLVRLTGGATMESWRFGFGSALYVLRRAPSLAMMADRPFGHASEAAIIRAAHAAAVTAPEVIAVLAPEDGLGSGFVMRALPGTPDPRAILAMDEPGRLLAEAARNLARIHAIPKSDLPNDVPTLDYAQGVANLREQFDAAGGDRPIIALGIRWLCDNLPDPVEPVLNHGDYRLGNLLADNSHLTGVLDWELAHFGDPHEDLAFGCMAVWRFARYDRPALGLGALADYFSAYEAESGRKVDPARFRFWTIYRTVWWALGCLKQAQLWRDGQDRMLERVVISRRTSEQELDLLLLLEEEAPEVERRRETPHYQPVPLFVPVLGEASAGEIATAISEWLTSIKYRIEGHDRFQLAVAKNALGILAREDAICPPRTDLALARELLDGQKCLQTPDLLAKLRSDALGNLSADVPKYPALAIARKKWTGEE